MCAVRRLYTSGMARSPIAAWFFGLVIVRKGDRFLAVRERKHGQGWYLPAGRIEAGESLEDGARREVLEETGVPVRLDGVLRIEHTPLPELARVRVFFVASPLDDRAPKTTPDEHSLEARWVTLAELATMQLRGREVLDIFQAVADGAPVYPMSLITAEGAPFATAVRS